VVVSGIGKSGHIARKLAATLASTGTPAFFVHPAEASHGDLGMITPADVVVMLSNSGETDELVLLTPHLKRQGREIVALTGNEQSSLAQAADVHIDAAVDAEACPLGLAPTASTTAMLALGDALAIALLDARGFSVEDFARSHPGGPIGRRLLTRVRDVMVSGDALPIVGIGATLGEAVVMMSSKGMGMTPSSMRRDVWPASSPTAICAGVSTRARHRRRRRARRHDANAAHHRTRAARDRLRGIDGISTEGDGAARRRRGAPAGRRAPPARPLSRTGRVMSAAGPPVVPNEGTRPLGERRAAPFGGANDRLPGARDSASDLRRRRCADGRAHLYRRPRVAKPRPSALSMASA
jgi:KpsF/GutQ family protein